MDVSVSCSPLFFKATATHSRSFHQNPNRSMQHPRQTRSASAPFWTLSPNYLWSLVLTTNVGLVLLYNLLPKEFHSPHTASSRILELHKNKTASIPWHLIKIWRMPCLANKPSDWQLNHLVTHWSLSPHRLCPRGLSQRHTALWWAQQKARSAYQGLSAWGHPSSSEQKKKKTLQD